MRISKHNRAPCVPPIVGVQSASNLSRLPRKLGVIGSGSIGCELTQAFTEVILDMAPRILVREDEAAAEVVRHSMAECGVRFEFNARVSAVRNRNVNAQLDSDADADDAKEPWIEVTTASGAAHCFSQLLVATGRKPNVVGLGLAAAEVQFDAVRGIKEDDILATSNARINAPGECCSVF